MVDWLPHQPYLLMEQAERLVAALALPPDPPGVAWVRLFACSAMLHPGDAFTSLFEQASRDWQAASSRPVIVSLAMQTWFGTLLTENNFHPHQDIVILEWENRPTPLLPAVEGLVIRPLLPSDLPAVTQLDNLCFEDIWQLSLDSLRRAYEQSSYRTVIELDGRIVAYQLSSENPFSAHLSRIATHPEVQGRHIASTILKDLLEHYVELGIWQVTVNTQSNNLASLSLYRSFGFQLTGERYPVFRYHWA